MLGHLPQAESSTPLSYRQRSCRLRVGLISKKKHRLMEDAQSVAGFGGQLCYMVGIEEFMANGETKKFRRLNLFQWLTMEMDRWDCLMILSE